MPIEIKLDYDGKPYLELHAEESNGKKDPENQMIELFIRKAKSKGIVIKNESSFEMADDYASIRLRS